MSNKQFPSQQPGDKSAADTSSLLLNSNPLGQHTSNNIIEILESRIAALRQAEDELQAKNLKISRLESEVQTLTIKLQNVVANAAKDQEKYEKDIISLKSECKNASEAKENATELLSRKENEMIQLQEKLHEVNADCERQICQQADRFQDELDEKRLSILKLEESLFKAQANVNQLESKASQVDRYIESISLLQAEIVALQNELDSSKVSSQNQNAKMKQRYNDEVTSLKNSTALAEQQRVLDAERIKVLEAEISLLTSQILDSKQKNDQLVNMCSKESLSQKEVISSLHEKLKVLKSETQELTEVNRKLQAANEEKQRLLSEITVKVANSDQQCAEFSERLSNTIDLLEKCDSDCRKKDDMIHQLQQECINGKTREEQWTNQATQLSTQLSVMREEMTELQRALAASEQSCQSSLSTIEMLKKGKDSIASELVSSNNELTQLEVCINTLQYEKSDLLQSLDTVKRVLNSEISEYREKNRVFEEKNASLQQIISDQKQKYEVLLSERDLLQSKYTTECNDNQRKIQDLLEKLSGMEDNFTQLQKKYVDELKQSEKSHGLLNNQLETSQAHSHKLSSKLQLLEEELEVSNTKLICVKDELQHREKEIVSLKEMLLNENHSKLLMKDEFTKTTASYEEKMHRLQKDNEDGVFKLQERLQEEFEGKLLSVSAQMNKLKSAHAAEIATLQESHTVEVEELQAQSRKELAESRSKLNSTINSMTSNLAQVKFDEQEKFNQIKHELELLRRQKDGKIADLEERFRLLEADNVRELARHESALSEVRDKLMNCQSHESELKLELSDLEQQLRIERDNKSQAIHKCRLLEDQVEHNTASIAASHEHELNAMKRQMKDMQRSHELSIQTKDNEIERLLKKNRMLSESLGKSEDNLVRHSVVSDQSLVGEKDKVVEKERAINEEKIREKPVYEKEKSISERDKSRVVTSNSAARSAPFKSSSSGALSTVASSDRYSRPHDREPSRENALFRVSGKPVEGLDYYSELLQTAITKTSQADPYAFKGDIAVVNTVQSVGKESASTRVSLSAAGSRLGPESSEDLSRARTAPYNALVERDDDHRVGPSRAMSTVDASSSAIAHATPAVTTASGSLHEFGKVNTIRFLSPQKPPSDVREDIRSKSPDRSNDYDEFKVNRTLMKVQDALSKRRPNESIVTSPKRSGLDRTSSLLGADLSSPYATPSKDRSSGDTGAEGVLSGGSYSDRLRSHVQQGSLDNYLPYSPMSKVY